MQQKVNIQALRSIKEQKAQHYHAIRSQEQLKSVINDYIIKQCYSKNIDCQAKGSIPYPKAYQKKAKLNKPTYTIAITLVQKERPVYIQLEMVLLNYITICSQLLQKGRQFEQIMSDVQCCVDHLMNSTFSVDQHRNQTIQSAIVEEIKEFRQKRRKSRFSIQYNELSQSAQYKNNRKVMFFAKNQRNYQSDFMMNENTEINSQRISRHTLNSLQNTQRYNHVMSNHQTKSKLKILIKKCNVFTNPHKLEALKKQMLIKQFCKNGELQYIEVKRQTQKLQEYAKNPNLSPQTISFLEDWIDDISLSEALFYNGQKSRTISQKNKVLKQMNGLDSQNSILA